MTISENVSLSDYSTMRLGGNARYLCEVHSTSELQEVHGRATQNRQPVIVIGEGSNSIWQDGGFDGLVIVNRIKGIDVQEIDEQKANIVIGGGENWDGVVEFVVEKGYVGIECLSGIPGTAGAGPVQNIGAYGQELSSTLVNLQALDTKSGQLVTIEAVDCGFGYRTSIFKTSHKGQYIITSITLRLHKEPITGPFYGSLQTYLESNNISEFTPEVLRKAVLAVRGGKLPDVSKTANCGSFFANPIVDEKTYQNLVKNYPELGTWHSPVFWQLSSGSYKVAAGALLELAGYKGVHDAKTGMAVWDKQALVLINESAKSTGQLLEFRDSIISKIQEKFGITLEQEPELLPTK